MFILTLNCRRYSVQYQLFDWRHLVSLATGSVERIVVGDSFITHEVPGRLPEHRERDCPDHLSALKLVLDTLTDPKVGVLTSVAKIKGIGHRVVHGGEKFTQSVLIDQEVVETIEEMAKLAPLHNTPNLAGIRAAQELLSDVPQVAIFDTAFHQTMPEEAYLYPLPYEWYEKHGIRRYGFHGQSHLYAARRGAALAGVEQDRANLVTIHTGDGVSLCAIRNGKSVDTSMGLTPLEGVMMGTRCGDIDPGIIPFMMNQAGVSAPEIDLFMNQKSGVAGIVGRRVNRRIVMNEANDGDERCRLALEMESYRLRKYLGAYIAVTGKPDAIVFTYGDGWADWPVRGLALAGMEQFGIKLDTERDLMALMGGQEMLVSADDSQVKVFVLPTGEDMVLNEDVATILGWRDLPA
ncbi:acetate kinase [Geomonas limicola]|uniref:Acetate kinase n=1 Tax=Geomonas limicola TaxID=2740186 RepID=A0A6V8NGJ8_9BACT|nr:acetate kinase [Geomonas limicola]GFO70079.1 acetate kinase [Geomonas limicola]